MKSVPRIIALSLIKSLLFVNQAEAADLREGSSAPQFNLRDQQGEQHDLADYRNCWLVVYFYPKDDTPGCTTEACKFRDDHFKLKALQAKVLGISLDDSASHEIFAKKYNLPFPLLADTEGKVSAAYGALWKLGPIKFARRHSFIIDRAGVIRKIYRDVEPETHSQRIIDDLRLLQATQ